MNTKVDPQVELKRLEDVIQTKKAELHRLEDIVIKASEPPEIDEAMKKTIDKLRKVMERYSNALASYNLPRTPRVKVTGDYLKELFNQSKEIKAKRDEYTEVIPEAEQKLAELKNGIQEKKNKIIDYYSDLLKKMKELKDFFNSLNGNIKPIFPKYIIPLKNISQKFRNSNRQLYSKMNEGINSFNGNLDKQRLELENQLNLLKKEIENEQSRRNNYLNAQANAKKLYDESVARKNDVDEKCHMLRMKIRKIKNKQKEFMNAMNISFKQRDELCLAKMKDLNAQNEKLDGLLKKIQSIHGNIMFTSNKLSAESDGASYTIKFRSMRKYAKQRKIVLQNIPHDEFRLYLMSRSELYKYYLLCKKNAEK